MWWYRLNDGNWVYNRAGQWFNVNGTQYMGSAASADPHAQLGVQTPPGVAPPVDADANANANANANMRFHNGYWWTRNNTGDWLYFRNGAWYTANGDVYARGDFRFNDGTWWRRGNDGAWTYFRDGAWYDQNGRFLAQAQPEELSQLGVSTSIRGPMNRANEVIRGYRPGGAFGQGGMLQPGRGFGTDRTRGFDQNVNPRGTFNPGGVFDSGTNNLRGNSFGGSGAGGANIGGFGLPR